MGEKNIKQSHQIIAYFEMLMQLTEVNDDYYKKMTEMFAKLQIVNENELRFSIDNIKKHDCVLHLSRKIHDWNKIKKEITKIITERRKKIRGPCYRIIIKKTLGIKVTFLGSGTSQGVPLIACSCEVCKSENFKDKRLRSSILVETSKTRVVVDSGPDFRQQLLREKITKLDAVVFTHEHKDHIAGLDEVKSFNYLYNKKTIKTGKYDISYN
jgi:hypothetical protein